MTAVITAERGRESLTRHGLEEYVSDCVILLDHRVYDQIATRNLRVMKYRGALHGTNEFPFLIGDEGISVLPITSPGLNHKVPPERIATGIPRLDAMLGGQGCQRRVGLEHKRPNRTLKTTKGQPFSRPAQSRELAELRVRLAKAEETLRAIRTGEVDTVVVAGKQGPQVFTLEGAEHAYRVLIECMNEGALTLTADAIILYANQCFAGMVKRPLEQLLGSSLHHLLSAADQAAVRLLLKRASKAGSKIQVRLKAGDGSQMPVQISIRPLPKNGFNRATIGMVVTDMTETRRTEEKLRT